MELKEDDRGKKKLTKFSASHSVPADEWEQLSPYLSDHHLFLQSPT